MQTFMTMIDDNEDYVLSESDKQFFDGIAEQLNELAEFVYQEYRPTAQAIIHGKINDEHEIELFLDSMVGSCYDDKVLNLYKDVIRSILYKYPQVAHDHVYMYYEMFEPEKIGLGSEDEQEVE